MKAVCVVILGVLCGLSKAGVCPGKSQSFDGSRCLNVVTDSESSFTDSRTYCRGNNSGELVTFTTTGQLYTATNYVSALGSSDTQHWVGYLYNGSQLQDVQGTDDAPAIVTAALLGGGVAEETGTCVAANTNGDLVRVDCTMQLGFVCLFSLSDPMVSMVLVNDSVVSGTATSPVGWPLNVECQFSDTNEDSVVEWSLNGASIMEGITTTSNRNVSQLALMPFLRCGEYRCTVTNSDGQTVSGSVQLFGDIDNTISPPDPVTAIATTPNTQTSLFVQWREPTSTFVINSLLVSYTLYYSTQSTINYTSSGPSIARLRVGPDGNGSYQLTGLTAGTIYFLGLRAENEQGMSSIHSVTQVAITYGTAPTTAPENLILGQNTEGNALLAEWDDVLTSLPVGRLAFYRVEFRDSRDDGDSRDITVLFINPRFSAASIFNVRNAQSYEVRVASAVQVQRSPADYELSPFTAWEEVTTTFITIPTIPTIEPIIEDDKTVEIVVAAVVPFVVLAALCVVIIIIAVVLHIKNRPDKNYIDGGGYVCETCKTNKLTKGHELEEKPTGF